jgi:hypothetical protein
LVAAAGDRGESAIGYRRRVADGDDRHGPFGIVLNPPKSVPMTVTATDQLIVIAEHG